MLDTIPGIELLTAVSTMYELGKFKATKVHMSKHGSRIARRAIFAVLRNNSAFELRSPEQHQSSYRQHSMLTAA